MDRYSISAFAGVILALFSLTAVACGDARPKVYTEAEVLAKTPGVAAECLVATLGKGESTLDAWVEGQALKSAERLIPNIGVLGAPGSVAASPQTSHPDYAWHWVRDAALVMDLVARRYQDTRDARLGQWLFDFAEFAKRNQSAATLSGLGEPKFDLQGRPFNGPWGRPQDDGPALRALTFIRFARALLSDKDPKNDAFVRTVLYDGAFPSGSVIKADLEYVAARIFETSFDLWEEVRGRHFYTGMVQRRALVEGAALARELLDFGAADWYEKRAALLTSELQKFWDGSKVVATRFQDGGLPGKSGLDASILLASLHADPQVADAFLPPEHPWIQATATALESRFLKDYRLNWGSTGAVMLGRYPEDQYYGGNPWYLTTLALVEVLERAAKQASGPQATALRDRADSLLERLSDFIPASGELAEQFDRDYGTPLSARDLSWSYVAFLTAAEARAGL